MLFNDYKNIKTIIFSELPHQEKLKYFNFLLENEINFSRDEQGNYVALVKVLNPAFYGENKDQKTGGNERNKSIDTKSLKDRKDTENEGSQYDGKPRSSSQAGKIQNQSQYQNLRGQPNKNMQCGKKPAFEREKKAITKKNYIDIFNGKYKNFLEQINPMIGVRGKKMNVNELKYAIEEIYSIRYFNDTNPVPNKGGEVPYVTFPNFVLEFLSNKYNKKPAIDQHALDILFSVDYYSKSNEDIDIFSKLMDEEYGPNELEFFLYVRSCIEKEMNMMFIEVAKENMKKQYLEDYEENGFLLNIKAVLSISNAIYGNDEESLNIFMKKFEAILKQNLQSNDPKKNMIKANQILLITLNDFHHSPDRRKEQDSNAKKESDTYMSLQKSYGDANISNEEEKINKIKAIIGLFIKRKELDIFFSKMLSSYSIHDKSNKSIEDTMTSIKELVSRKINLLINILFDQNERGWYESLHTKQNDPKCKESYNQLQSLIHKMMDCNQLCDISEELLEEFAGRLLLNHELNNQINHLVQKRFE